MQTLLAAFDNSHEAQELVNDLVASGYSREQIDIMDQQLSARDTQGAKDEGWWAGLKRWLGGYNLEENDQDLYSETVRRGSTLVSVRAEDQDVDRITDLMNRHGAIDIDHRADFYRKSGFQRFDASTPPYSRDEMISERERFAPGGDFAIPVIEEDVKVGKRKIDKGRVRVVSRVTERPVEESVQLREEHVDVERRAVDRPVNAGDMDAFKEGTMEFSESDEEAVVDKEARVVEEVRVKKDTEERTETIHETARRRDVDVERSDDRRGRRP